MHVTLRNWSQIMLVGCSLVIGAASCNAFAKAPGPITPEPTLGNDEQTFIFTGQCPNGERYRIYSYQKIVENIPQTFYAYEGPAGKGTVRTAASPKTMSVRVCRKFAEIDHQHQLLGMIFRTHIANYF
jgi:hypothetical protein